MDVGRGAYWLRSSAPLEVENDRATAIVPLTRGARLQLSLTYSEESPAVLVALGDEVDRRIAESVAWWQEWSSQCSYRGPYRDAVLRSALALKLLAYAPSGAITAAATTSLPERIGDTLNWDYRYCWLRDASLTIRSLMGLGYTAEAESFLNWLLHATRLTHPRLRVLYNVYGGNAPRERDLRHLSGYRDSKPVRVGNLARGQLQLDVYGEVIDGATQFARHAHRLDHITQKALVRLGKYVAQNWDQPDEGMWEPRSGRQNHTHSRLMCWVALDRLLTLHSAGIIESVPRDFFHRERERLRQQILQRGWNDRLQSYVSTLDTEEIDATLLRIPWYGFEKSTSSRMKKTHKRVMDTLAAGNGLLYRYLRQPAEGAFGICGFWAVEYLAMGGASLDEAHEAFEQLLPYANDLGLFAEQIDPRTGDALGNFPQAFTHVGLISAALALEERRRGEPHPSEKTAEQAAAAGGKGLR
jgi:GH15 family glucan-1,4-alpha-glucosidase